jgi:hypothetical protein
MNVLQRVIKAESSIQVKVAICNKHKYIGNRLVQQELVETRAKLWALCAREATD